MGKHILTIDLEEWFHLAPDFAPPENTWVELESRVEFLTYKLLDILDEYASTATFFVLGWIAKQHPDLIREISDRGHEIANHGYCHKPLSDLSPDEFTFDLSKAANAIYDTGVSQRISGYRAPNYSVTPETAWALEILANEGYSYDASVFPMMRHDGGWPNAPEKPYKPLENRDFWEIPIPRGKFGPFRFIFSAGGFLRISPVSVVLSCLKKLDRLDYYAVFVIHPKDIDPDSPFVKKSTYTTIRQKAVIGSTVDKLKAVLSEYKLASIKEIINDINRD